MKNRETYLRMGLPPSFLGSSHCRSTYLLVTALTVRAYGGPGEAATETNRIIFGLPGEDSISVT